MGKIINEVSVGTKNALKGKISILKTLHGKSAFEVAVINGFSGTEAEWLETLKGEKGDTLSIEEIIADVITQTSKISTVTLLANQWQGEASPYSQVVVVDGATANSQVDLTPSVEQLSIFYEKDLTFVTENDGGVVTVYAIGQKPQNDYTIQVTITEVAYE